jgi:Flp pilus assembly protein TadG
MSRLWNRLRRIVRKEDGTAMVELALALPFLVALVFGILDFGRAYNYWLDSTHLANEAARMAAVGQPIDRVLDGASTPELKNGGGSVVSKATLTCSATLAPGSTNLSPDVGDQVKVTITSTYHFLPLPIVSALGNKTIQGSATMRLEGKPPSGC